MPGGTATPRARGSRAASLSSASARANPRTKSILYLEQNQAQFNAPSKRESVFFDECNREIINVTSGHEQTNKTRVVFQRTDLVAPLEFVLPVEKRILSIKLNSNRNVLAYHVERNIIEFINVHEQVAPDGTVRHVLDNKRYVQNSRAKNSKLIGFLWTGSADLVIITDLSVEFYHVDSGRHRTSHVKMFQSATNWFVYQPHVPPPLEGPSHNAADPLATTDDDTNNYSILMVSTGSLGNSMQPYMFSRGRIVRLQRFEVEGSWQDSEKLELFERSITIAHIYGRVRLLVLQHESLNVKSKGAQIVIFTVDPTTGVTSHTHTLDLDVSGRFAINVLDNLVVAHDQPSKSSFVFDIMIKSTEKSDCPDHFVSLLDSRPIKQLEPQLQADNVSKPVDMYSLNWVFFQPHFIVDAKLGLLTTLKLDLQAITEILQDNNLVLSFLAHRRNSATIIMAKCRQIVADSYAQATSGASLRLSPLAEVSATFEHLGRLVISAPGPVTDETKQTPQDTKPNSRQDDVALDPQDQDPDQMLNEPSICQKEFQAQVLDQVFGTSSPHSDSHAHYHFVSSSLLEFIFVIRRHNKQVERCIYEQLLECMLGAGRHFQVVQLVRGGLFKHAEDLVYSKMAIPDQYWLSV